MKRRYDPTRRPGGKGKTGARAKNRPPPNPAGRPKGRRNKLTLLKFELVRNSGLMPLDFLLAVMRDELVDRYEQSVMPDGKTVVFKPAEDAKKIKVTTQQRITCADRAAPYLHKKMPVGIELGDRNNALIHAERLRDMPQEQIEGMLAFFDALGLTPELEPRLIGHGSTAEPAPDDRQS